MFDLTQTLKRRNLTLEEAAQETGLPIKRLREIAQKRDCSLKELRLISRKLSIPTSDLVKRKPDEPPVEVLFRKTLSKYSAKEEPIIFALASEVANIMDVAPNYPPNTQWIDDFRRQSSGSKNVETLAQVFRGLFFENDQESPLTNLPALVADRLGVILLIKSHLPIEGASVRYKEHAFAFLAPRTFRARMLFTLAHEVGHLVADESDQTGDFATYDSEDELSQWSRKRGIEDFANRFASALLVPASAVGQALKAIRNNYKLSGELGDIEINYLSRIFGVSFEVAGRRCEQLGLLPDFGGRILYEKVCREHGNPERRADELGLPPRQEIQFSVPQALIRSIALRIRSGHVSAGRAAEVLHVTLSDLFSANVESGA